VPSLVPFWPWSSGLALGVGEEPSGVTHGSFVTRILGRLVPELAQFVELVLWAYLRHHSDGEGGALHH
jgi:hypothetical protein